MYLHLMSRGCYYWKAGRVDSLGSLAPGSHNLTRNTYNLSDVKPSGNKEQ